MKWACLAGFAAALCACGDDGGGATPDAAPPPDAVSLDGNPFTGEFDDPSDFDPVGCVPGSLAGLDPQGIWHQDIHIDGFGSFAAATRFDPSGTGFTALINSRPTDDVRLTDDYLFVRLVYTTNGGATRVRTFYACARAADGSLSGKTAYCQGTGCLTGTFQSVRVQRIAGESEAQGLTLVGEFSGDPATPWPSDGYAAQLSVNVRVADGVAYVARYTDGLRIVDVSDPAQPHDLGAIGTALPDVGEIYNDVKIADGPTGKRYALMASDERGIVVVDVTDPANPVERGTFPAVAPGDSVGVHTLFTEQRGGQNLAYLANTTTIGLDVYDITDPEAPVALGSYVDDEVATDFNAYLHDLYVENGLAYLDYWDLGLIIVDCNDPAAISKVGQYRDYDRRTNHSNWVTTAGGRKVSVMGDEDFGAHMRIVDVDPASPQYMMKIGELQLRPEVSIHNIMAFGDLAYVVWYQDGVRVVDLSDPTAPHVIAYYNTWDGRDGLSFYEAATGIDVDLTQSLIYVADIERGLLILRQP